MSIADRIARGLKASLAAQAVFTASNAVLVLLLTRYLLTPGEFGLLQFALSVLGVLAIFGTLGLPKSTARYVTEYVEQDPSQVRFILRRSIAAVAIMTVVVGGALVVGDGPTAAMLGERRLAPLLLVGAGYVAFRAFSDYLAVVFQGFNRVDFSALVTATSGLGRAVFGVAFVVAGFGALGALLGYVAGFAVAALVGGYVLYTRFYASFEEGAGVESGLVRRLLEYSVPLTATRGASVLDSKVDSILVGVLLNPTAVGFYAIAQQVAQVVTVPASSFGFTISPTIGEQRARDRTSTAARLYERSLTYVLLFYVPAAAGLAIVAEPLVRLVFGPDYVPAAPVLQVLGAYVVVHAVNKITSDGLDYLGRARSRAVAHVLMAVSNFGLNLLLIPSMGVVGAAVATVVTAGAYTLFNVYTIHRELSLRIGHVLGNAAVVGLITCVMAVAVVASVPFVSGLPSLLGVVLFGGGVWATLALLSGMVDVREIASYL